MTEKTSTNAVRQGIWDRVFEAECTRAEDCSIGLFLIGSSGKLCFYYVVRNEVGGGANNRCGNIIEKKFGICRDPVAGLRKTRYVSAQLFPVRYFQRLTVVLPKKN